MSERPNVCFVAAPQGCTNAHLQRLNHEVAPPAGAMFKARTQMSIRCAGTRLVLLFGSCLSCGTLSTDQAHRKGPLAVRSDMPLSRIFLQMPAESARVTDPGGNDVRLQSSYTSVFTGDGENGTFVSEDGEILAVDGAWRHGFGSGLEAGVQVPVIYASSGFLDSFVNDYHDAFNLPDAGRDEAPTDQYSAVFVNDGVEAWQLEEDSVGLADIPLWIAASLAEESEDVATVKAKLALELPTGNAERGFGNGKLDGGLQLLAERGFGRFVAYGSVAGLLCGTPNRFRDADVDTNPYYSAAAGGELLLNDAWSLHLQLDYLASPLHDVDTPAASDDQLLISFGASVAIESTVLTAFFLENLTGDTAPDFSLQVGLRTTF